MNNVFNFFYFFRLQAEWSEFNSRWEKLLDFISSPPRLDGLWASPSLLSNRLMYYVRLSVSSCVCFCVCVCVCVSLISNSLILIRSNINLMTPETAPNFKILFRLLLWTIPTCLPCKLLRWKRHFIWGPGILRGNGPSKNKQILRSNFFNMLQHAVHTSGDSV